MLSKANLDMSRQFDAFWWSTLPEVVEAAKFIRSKMPETAIAKFKNKRLLNHLKVILTNLNVAHKYDPKEYVAISMSKNSYRVSRRYRELYLRYEYVKFLVNYLLEKGYLEFHRGVNYPGFQRMSRIRAAQKLLRLFRKYRSDGGKTFRRTLPIVLRDSDKNNIDFDPNQSGVREMIRSVNRINNCLSRHKVEIDVPDYEEYSDFGREWLRVEPYCKYSRIFNNSSFSEGGRLYGHWSQMIQSEYRQYITIDGQPTVELDYSCLHIFMLYCMAGMEPPSGDLYKLAGIDESFRPFVKKAVNILFNAETETKAKQAINRERPNFLSSCPWIAETPTATELIDAFKATHPAISDYICTGMGVKLQNLDSQIASDILNWFTERDICCLTIHDSFIIGNKYQEVLYNLMTECFRLRFGYMPLIKSH